MQCKCIVVVYSVSWTARPAVCCGCLPIYPSIIVQHDDCLSIQEHERKHQMQCSQTRSNKQTCDPTTAHCPQTTASSPDPTHQQFHLTGQRHAAVWFGSACLPDCLLVKLSFFSSVSKNISLLLSKAYIVRSIVARSKHTHGLLLSFPFFPFVIRYNIMQHKTRMINKQL